MPVRASAVKIGAEYEVRIESQSRRGDSGVARVMGLVVFVPNARTSDSVRIRIIKIGDGYATAELIPRDNSSANGPGTG